MSYLNGIGSAFWHASGASSLVGGIQDIYNNSGRGGTWSGMARGAVRMAAGGAALSTISTAPVRTALMAGVGMALSPTASTTARETLGPVVKRVGKQLGNQSLIDRGRRLHYGHLPADRLFREHPAAFLRQFAVQSIIQPPDRPGGVASTRERFQFRTITTKTSLFPHMRDITDSSGRTRPAKGHLQLLRSADQDMHRDINDSEQVGSDFHAAFLPMLQAKDDRLGPRAGVELTEHTLPGFDRGRIDRTDLDRRNRSIAVTTQLSGCSVTRHGDSVLHIRPHSNGNLLQRSLPEGHTFGRDDYPVRGQEAFAMVVKKPNGITRLHYQTHDSESGEIRSGRRDL